MTVYVKEYNSLTLSSVLPLININIDVKIYSDNVNINTSDVIIVSKEDPSNNLKQFHTIIYEDIFNLICNNLTQEYTNHHDYYYLSNSLEAAKSPAVTTIIAGSSYGVFDINCDSLENTVNLSAPSQDLYYSLAMIKEAVNNNHNIKNVVLCHGYYFFYHDLSLSQNPEQQLIISDVYYPLLNDSHNCLFMRPSNQVQYQSNVFNLDSLIKRYSKNDYCKGFFNESRPRNNFANKSWEDKSKSWSELGYSEKLMAGFSRASWHNKKLIYDLTYAENLELLQELVTLCEDNNINFILAVPPMTNIYLKYLNPTFISDFYSALNKCNGTIHLFDFANDETFDVNTDFNDVDHLNDSGASKFTQKIAYAIVEVMRITADSTAA